MESFCEESDGPLSYYLSVTLFSGITILDKVGKVAAQFGANDHADEVGTNKTEPDKWRPGIVTAPHGVACNERGDIFVSEYNIFGRVHRFNRE